MSLSIKNSEAERLARELVEITGESLTEAVVVSLSERLARKKAQSDQRPLHERLNEIGRRFSQNARTDGRTLDEIIGYDDAGLPT